MNRNNEKNLIVGLDIGTSKVVAIVGEINNSDEIEVVGIGSHPSKGLKRGVVVNIESTVHSIQKAVEEAELIINKRIDLWQQYHEAFNAIEKVSKVRRPIIPKHCNHNAHIYYLLLSGLLFLI